MTDKRSRSFLVNGTKVDVPEEELEDFQNEAVAHNATPDELHSFRVTTADGKGQDVTVAESERADFESEAARRGATFEPLRTLVMDDGTERTMPAKDISSFLRSREYRESEDYKRRKAAADAEMGSPALAALTGALGGFFSGAWAGGNAVANKMVKALPELGIEVENAAGHVARAAGKGLKALGANDLGESVESTGEGIVNSAAEAKAWLDAKLPSETKDWQGYEDWSAKLSDWIGNASAMAVKFAPGMAKEGVTAFMNTVFATDGANAAANAYDEAKKNGLSTEEAAAVGSTAFLVNYFGGKLVTKAGGIAEGVENPILKFLTGGAASGHAMGLQNVGNTGVENVTKGRPITEGMGEAYVEGQVEGMAFHAYNALPGFIGQMRAGAEARHASEETARREILEMIKSDDGRATLAMLAGSEELDAAIRARKSGERVTREMAIAARLPETMTPTEVNQVLDAVANQRTAQAERVRTGMDDVQAAALAETVKSLAGEGEIMERTWLKAVEKITDARDLDDPDIREKLVAKAAKEAAAEIEGERRAVLDEQSRIRGLDVRGQLDEMDKRGVMTWEDAEADGLVRKDEQGRWTGGARQAVNIAVNGTETLKTAVKDGAISGDLAEEMITLSHCELGWMPKEAREAIIDKVLDAAGGNAEMAQRMMEIVGRCDRAELADVDARVRRVADQVTEVLAEAARAKAVNPEGREPQTAYEGAVNAERMKGTELRSVDGGVMACERFPEVTVEIDQDGIHVRGMTDALMSKPENAADAAALLSRLENIAKQNGQMVDFGGDKNAETVARGIIDEVNRGGLERTQRMLETRSRLFEVLMESQLGNGVTYDEASFAAALEKTPNGRKFRDNHGNIYGFKDADGVLHFNPTALNLNTPIHEYGHLALEALRKVNPTLLKRGMDLIAGSDYYGEIRRNSETEGHEYSYLKGDEEGLRDEALVTMIGDRGQRLVEQKGLGAELKAWMKEFWKALKGAFGVADLTDEQIEKMSLGEFVDAVNAELLRGKEFGTRKQRPLEKRSITRYDEDQGSGANGMLRWRNDRGYLFALPVDMERTRPGGKVVLARDDANITDWIQSRLNGVELRMSKNGKIYVKGANGLEGELAEIFGRYPTIGKNNGIFENIATDLQNESLREMTPDQLVEALRKDRANYDAWTAATHDGKTLEALREERRAADEAEREEFEARERYERSGMEALDYVRSRIDEGEPGFDLDWETMRELAREAEQGKFAIGGKGGAKEIGIGKMDEAEAMEKAGAGREEIWRKTGWWRGKDGKWRVELPDVQRKEFEVDPETRHFRGGGNDFYRFKLAELVEDGDFMKAYPQARKIKVEFHKKMPENEAGNFNEATLTIKLPHKMLLLTDWGAESRKYGQDFGNAKTAQLNERGRQSIVHELQHAIQLFENFAKGGSPTEPVRHYALDGNTGHALSVFSAAVGMDPTNDRHLQIIANWAQKITSDYTKGDVPKRLVESFESAAKEAGKTPQEFRDEIERLYDSHTETPVSQYYKLAGEVEARNVQARLGMTAEERAATPPWETEDMPENRQIAKFAARPAMSALAKAKVGDSVEGVSEDGLRNEVERRIEAGLPEKEYRFKKPDDRKRLVADAVKFYKRFSQKTVMLSDGRCVYFVPDARAKNERGLSNEEAWAEYAIHAVTSSGERLEGKDYNERLYNRTKAANIWRIENILKAERCEAQEEAGTKRAGIAFYGRGIDGKIIRIITRLDESDNIYADLSEVTVVTDRKIKKLPPRKPPAEVVGAVRKGGDLLTDDASSIPNSGAGAQGGKRAFNGVTPEEDAAYAEAVKRGDMETVRRMEREVYERMGYSDDSGYQGTSAFNGAAPSRNAYFETKAERIEATKNGEMEDTTTLGDFRDGIDLNNLQFIVFDPRSERNTDAKRQEAIRNIRGVLDGGKDTITMYRSVPADVKEGQFRNGDWITPSRAYAEENARIHGWKESRIIEQEVSIEDVWWDGNDIAEWGFDDGKGSVYTNTLANRKLLGPTYDDAGNLIPLSKRFNDWKNDVRFHAGRGLDGSETIIDASVFIAGRARVADDAGVGEQTPGALAASRELATQGATPISLMGQFRKMSLPMSEIEHLRRLATGDRLPVHVARRMPGGRAAAHTRAGQLFIAADVFGTVDKTDMENEKAFLRQHGFFMNEDANWCSNQTGAAIRAEQRRSEEQLATRLLHLGSRRVRGVDPGGQEAGRRVLADEVAKIVMDLPQQLGGTLGRVQTIGKGVRDDIRRRLNGSNDQAKREAGDFLDWAYGSGIVDPATGNTVARADAMALDELTSSMFGAWLVMPHEVEMRAPNWDAAFVSAIAGDQRLATAWRELSVRAFTERSHSHVEAKIRQQLERGTQAALMKLQQEADSPISAGSRMTDLKETMLVGFHDKFAPVYVRVDEKLKDFIKAKKAAIRTATSALDRQMLRAEIDRFGGQMAAKLHKLELSRTASERGAWNEGRRYWLEMARLENDATRWGLTEEDKSLYLELKRVVETQGRAASFMQDARQAQMSLDDMKRRLGAAGFARLEDYTRRFHAIIEREIYDDARLERALGKGLIDYFRSQSDYVTTKRTWSKDELDAIETARADARAAGVAGGDDVVSGMYRYAGARGAGDVVGLSASEWTAALKGSAAARQESRSATWAKQSGLMQFARRNQMVLDLRDVLLSAGVEGVRELSATEGGSFPKGNRYGHIAFMENGQKKILVVPTQIAEAFKTDPDRARWLTVVNGLVRTGLIDYNVAYGPMNVRRNQASLELNMEGMRETYLKTALRAVAPGAGPTADLALQMLVRKVPVVSCLFGKHTVYAHIPKALRYVRILEDLSGWQKELWEAEDAHDAAKVTRMYDDYAGVMEMLKGNMFIPTSSAYAGGDASKGFAFDAMNRKGLKTVAQIEEESRGDGRWSKFCRAVNVFKKNQAWQEHEEMLAKTIGYLHDRMFYENSRTVQESGLAVKRNVSIAEGERKGRYARTIQHGMAQFYNMVEKGVVRHWRNFKERPGEMAAKDAKIWIGRAMGMMLANGAIRAWLLADCDGDEEKAQKKYGRVYDYAKAYQTAYKNCSSYVKENYNFTPLWNSADGMTSVVLGGALTDEDKLIAPTADFIAGTIAHKMGVAPKPELGKTLANSTFKAVTPDLALSAPIMNFLRSTVEATFVDNPTDFFRNAPMYDQTLWEVRNESWEMRGKFAAAMGAKLWSDMGGRALLPAGVNGVDNGRGSAPQTLEMALRSMPVVSPVIGRMLKIQVGSPNRQGEAIVAEDKRRRAIIDQCAKDLMKRVDISGVDFYERDPEAYEKQLQTWKDRYGLNDFDVQKLRVKYLNGTIQRKNRMGYDQRELGKLRKKARELGMSDEEIWLQLGDM